MSLNDERERLDIAEEYLLTFPASSQEFEAALEHLRWVRTNKPDWTARCEQVVKNVIIRRRDETHIMAKLRSFT